MTTAITNFSQHGEQRFIDWYFSTQRPTASGAFLDIGAADGKTFSNTHALALKGWRGVCVEPSPFVFPALANLYKGESSIMLVNAGLSAQSELKLWFDSGGDMVSTFDDVHRDLWAKSVNYHVFLVCSITWTQLIEAIAARLGNAHMNFVSIDVEGSNAEVLASMPLDRVRPVLLCVEDEPTKPTQRRRMIAYAEAYGYTLVHEENVNLFFAQIPLTEPYTP